MMIVKAIGPNSLMVKKIASCPEADVIAVIMLYRRAMGFARRNSQTIGKSPVMINPAVVIQIAETLTPNIIWYGSTFGRP
jgi:hypothetical protein